MPDLLIHRDHTLGLPRAREIARQWVDDAERRLALRCASAKGLAEDRITFQGPGVEGTLEVAADHFRLQARLGFLLGTFSLRIEQEIERQLDALLEGPGARSDG